MTSAFSHFWQQVDAAIRRTEEYGLPANVTAEGKRYALQLAKLALDVHVDNQDPARPLLTEMIGPTLKWGWDNPFTTYHYAPLDDGMSYRFFGARNESIYLGVTIYGEGNERKGEMPKFVLGSFNDTDLPVDEHGRFEVRLDPSVSGASTGVIPLPPGSSSMIVRQYFSDPLSQTASLVKLETKSPVGPPPLLTEALLTERIEAASRFFGAMWGMSDAVVARITKAPANEFHPPLPGGLDTQGKPSGHMYPTVDNLYVFGNYDVKDDEVLIVDVTPPTCRYWSFYLGTVFQQSHPYGPNFGLHTRENTTVKPDGSLRFHISRQNPGVDNWLGTEGHVRGMMAMRFLLADVATPPVPSCHLLKLTDFTS